MSIFGHTNKLTNKEASEIIQDSKYIEVEKYLLAPTGLTTLATMVIHFPAIKIYGE